MYVSICYLNVLRRASTFTEDEHSLYSFFWVEKEEALQTMALLNVAAPNFCDLFLFYVLSVSVIKHIFKVVYFLLIFYPLKFNTIG